MKSFTFNGVDMKEFLIVTNVKRSISSEVENKLLETENTNGAIYLKNKFKPMYIIVDFAYKASELSPIRRLLSRLLLTDDLEELIFSDEPNIYYNAKIDGKIDLSEESEHATGTITFIIPEAVGHSRELTVKNFNNVSYFNLLNNGSAVTCPIFDFSIKSKTYLIGITSPSGSYQFGDSLEASNFKDINTSLTESQNSTMAIRQSVLIDDVFKNSPGSWGSSYDITPVNPSFVTSGSFSLTTTTPKGIVDGKITVAKNAQYWQTGEKMADWVKGKTFVCDGEKTVNQSMSKKAYRLKDGSTYLGWLLEENVEGQQIYNAGALTPNYGTVINNKWHGPTKDKTFLGNPKDWRIDCNATFKLGNTSEYGKMYFGICQGLRPLFGVCINADQAHRFAEIVIITRGGDLKFDYDPNNNFFLDFQGVMSIIKSGLTVTFEFKNLKNGKTLSQSYQTYKELAEMSADRVILWAGRYSNLPTVSQLGFEAIKVTGFDSEVYVDSNTPDIPNLPDPKYELKAGDILRVNMNNGKSYVNGIETNNPVAYGSKTIALKPGQTELIVTTDCVGVTPSLEVFFRERYI